MKFDITFNGVPLTDFGGRYRINRHSSLAGYMDFLRSGGMPSRRTEALVRKAEAKRHKKFNAYARKRGHFMKAGAPHTACPVCGRVRRAGYYNACPDCYPILGFRRRLSPLLDDLARVLERSHGRLSYEFRGDRVLVRVEAVATLHAHDADFAGGTGNSTERPIRCGDTKELGLRGLMSSGNREAIVADVTYVVAGMWEATLQKVRTCLEDSADGRGNSVLACGVPIPAAGNWRMP